MITKISIISGQILTLLEDHQGPLSIEEIEFYTGEPLEIIPMSVGWLTREGHVHLELQDEKYVVSKQSDISFLSRRRQMGFLRI
jgi:hypothetical protein